MTRWAAATRKRKVKTMRSKTSWRNIRWRASSTGNLETCIKLNTKQLSVNSRSSFLRRIRLSRSFNLITAKGQLWLRHPRRRSSRLKTALSSKAENWGASWEWWLRCWQRSWRGSKRREEWSETTFKGDRPSFPMILPSGSALSENNWFSIKAIIRTRRIPLQEDLKRNSSKHLAMTSSWSGMRTSKKWGV